MNRSRWAKAIIVLLHFTYIYTQLQYKYLVVKKKNSIEKLLLKELNCIQSVIEVSAVIMFPTWKMHYFISYYLYSVYFPYLITVLFIDNLKSVILIHVSSSSKTSTN